MYWILKGIKHTDKDIDEAIKDYEKALEDAEQDTCAICWLFRRVSISGDLGNWIYPVWDCVIRVYYVRLEGLV